MKEVLVKSHKPKQNNLLVGLVVIALISVFKIAGNCVAYRQTATALSILREPPHLAPASVAKELDNIQDIRETIRDNLAIETLVFLITVGCLLELKRKGVSPVLDAKRVRE